MYTVIYGIVNQPRQSAHFETIEAARAFMQALSINPNCDSYYLQR